MMIKYLIFICFYLGIISSCHDKVPESPIIEIPTELELEQLGQMPPDLHEISGMINLFNGHYLCNNDGGNGAFLFDLDNNSYQVAKKYFISDAVNKDWEALTMDEEHIYIGDFGNNSGARKDLSIYKLLKNDFLSLDSISSSTIKFSYEDQTEFEPNSNHNFDCEAFISLGEKLILFTKNRENKMTNIYELNKSDSIQIAKKVSMFDSKTLITDAVYDEANDRLYLLGYRFKLDGFESSFWIIHDWQTQGFTSDKNIHLDIPDDLQLESMLLHPDGYMIMANEEELLHNGVIFKADLSSWIE